MELSRNGAPASKAPRTAAYHVIGSDEFEFEQESGTAINNPRYLRVLVMVVGALLGCFLVLLSFWVFISSVFLTDSGKMEGLYILGSWVWLLSFLVMALAIGVIKVSCQYATNQKNGRFVVQSLGVLLVYDVMALLLYFPWWDWLLTRTADSFFGFSFYVLMRLALSLWLPWKVLNRLGWTPHLEGALLLSHCACCNNNGRPRRTEVANRFGMPEV